MTPIDEVHGRVAHCSSASYPGSVVVNILFPASRCAEVDTVSATGWLVVVDVPFDSVTVNSAPESLLVVGGVM